MQIKIKIPKTKLANKSETYLGFNGNIHEQTLVRKCRSTGKLQLFA